MNSENSPLERLQSSQGSMVQGKKPIQTKNILLQFPNPTMGVSSFTFHIPCYIRLEVKNFISLSLPDLKAQIYGKVMLDVQVTDLPPKIKDFIKRNIILRFNDDPALLLDQQTPEISIKSRKLKGKSTQGEDIIEDKRKHEILTFRIRKQLSTKIVPSILWTPYEMLYLIISITIANLSVERQQSQNQSEMVDQFNRFLKEHTSYRRENTSGKNLQDFKQDKFSLKFNIMDFNFKEYEVRDEKTNKSTLMMSRVLFSNDTTFGNYDLAERLIKVEYTKKSESRKVRELQDSNNEINLNCCYNCFYSKEETKEDLLARNHLKVLNEKRNKNKIQTASHAHFQLPIYRRPIVALVTIFAPLWLLGLISLGIFFQDNSMASRVGSIATIMLAHVAFMPVVRAQLPPTPRITFVEVLIYLQILITFFCLIESFQVLSPDYVFDWQTNILFIICLSIQIFETMIIIISIIVYYCCWLPSYNIKKGLSIFFNINDWSNRDRDEHYREQIDKHNYDVRQLESLLKNDEEKNKDNC